MVTGATYFDGKSARARDASLQLLGSVVEVRAGKDSFRVDRDNARILPPVGSGTWVIELADGGQLHFDNAALGDELVRRFGGNRIIDTLERNWRWALLALAVAIAGSWAMLTYGVPVAARHIAFAVPEDLDRRLGDESIVLLDKVMFSESTLEEADRSRIRALFGAVRDEYPDASYYRLEFRDSPVIGANAFAVPGGLVVLTDEMVQLTKSDAELVAVLAHEIGHLQQRHGLRILLQNSISAIIIAGLTGDLSNITAFSATIPTLLMQAKYSRDFEREADDFAFDYMERRGLDPSVLSELLLRLEETEGNRDDPLNNWLSSHPRSDERRPDD